MRSLISILVLFLVPLSYGLDEVSYIQSFHLQSNDAKFHSVLAYDDHIYVGGRNVLLQLDQNLVLQYRLDKGPFRNGDSCIPLLSCPDGSLQPNDYKVLAVSTHKNQLLACGTSDQGMCTIHSLDNITNYKNVTGDNNSQYVASRKTSLISFSSSGENVVDIAYAFYEQDNRNNLYAPYFTISKRKLELEGAQDKFRYLYYDGEVQQFSGLSINEDFIRSYYMTFVYTFQYKNKKYGDDSQEFVYVVMNSQRSRRDNSLTMKIGRFCAGDKIDTTLDSYIETNIDCKQSGTVYNVATAATFSNGNLYISAVHQEDGVIQSTALCTKTIDHIDSNFADILIDCFVNSEQSTPLSWIQPLDEPEEKKCIADQVISCFLYFKFYLFY